MKKSCYIKFLNVIMIIVLLAGCGENVADSSSEIDLSKLKPDNIVISGNVVSAFDTDEELTEKLGNMYAADESAVSNKIEKKTIIMKTDEGEKHGMTYRALEICNPEYRGEEFVCFNGINGKSSSDEVKKILGENCIEVETSNNDDFFCYFVDGEEIDYSKVKIPDGYVDTLGVCPYGRAYCEDFITEGTADYYIEWKFFQINKKYYDCIITLYQKA